MFHIFLVRFPCTKTVHLQFPLQRWCIALFLNSFHSASKLCTRYQEYSTICQRQLQNRDKWGFCQLQLSRVISSLVVHSHGLSRLDWRETPESSRGRFVWDSCWIWDLTRLQNGVVGHHFPAESHWSPFKKILLLGWETSLPAWVQSWDRKEGPFRRGFEPQDSST